MEKRPWTQDEILILKNGEIPEKRSRFSIKCMRQRLGLVSYNALRWTKEHKETLKKLILDGKSYDEISKMLPYSVKGIQKQVLRMNLQKSRQYKFTVRELIKFRSFLEKNWEGRTPAELMEAWNTSNKKQICKNKVVYHLRKLGVKIPKEESLRLGFLKKKEKNIYNSCKNTNESSNKIRSLRVELMKKRVEQNKDLWTGLVGHNVFSWDDNE